MTQVATIGTPTPGTTLGPETARSGAWPPSMPNDCDLQAVVNLPGHSTSFFYNRVAGDDGQPHHGSAALREYLASLSPDIREQVHVGVRRDGTLAPGSEPLRGEAGIRRLERLATEMKREEDTDTIDRNCSVAVSSGPRREQGLQLALRPPTPVGGVSARRGAG